MVSEQDILDEENEGPNKEERVLGALCYAPFGFIIPFLMQKQSDFLTFHMRQGAVIFLIYFVINFIPLPLIFGLTTLVYLGLAGVAGWRAYNGEQYMYGFMDKIFEQFKK